MDPFPHHYVVTAAARRTGDVPLSAQDVPVIDSAPPKEFDGPGDRWSPEALLTAAVADCFVLGFRAAAAGFKLSWVSLDVRTEGTVERVDGKTRFTRFATHATLRLPPGGDAAQAEKLLQKAEANCLVTNSLRSEVRLTTAVTSD